MSKPKEIEVEVAENPDVVIVKTATAPKLSPRGEGGITYQVGRIGDDVYVRIAANDGGGRHSKEWIPVRGETSIRAALTPAMRRGEPFKSDALFPAFVGRSQCNSGFLVATLRAVGILGEAPEHKGMSCLTGDLDAWEAAMRKAEPPLVDGKPETLPLHPVPKETKFQPKAVDEPAPPDAPTADSEAKPKGKKLNRAKKKAVRRPIRTGRKPRTRRLPPMRMRKTRKLTTNPRLKTSNRMDGS